MSAKQISELLNANFVIPKFKEVYKRKERDGIVSTICELRNLETNEVIKFGVNKIGNDKIYNKNLAKKLAYSQAVRFLFLQIADGKMIIEDNILNEKSKA